MTLQIQLPSKPRLLVVEDELIIAADIVSRLTRLGYEVVGQADEQQEAIRLAEKLRPDLILMDIRLQGDGDGIAAATEIRQRFRIPVVYLTAHADEVTLQRAKITEPSGYLLKPFEERELRTAIEIALYKNAAECRLLESERRYATTLSSIGDAVVATDIAGRVTFLNPVAERLTGWPLAEAKGLPLAEVFRIVNEHTRLTVENPVEKVLATGTVVGLANSTILISRDGNEYPIDDCASPILDDANQMTGVVLVFRDVTNERRREAELRQAQKMEAVGRLAGGIAHDFNNLLTVINGYAALVRDGIGPESPWYESLEQIETAGQRAADLTRQLLTFCRKQTSNPRVVDLNSLVTDNLKMLQRTLPANITVTTQLHPTPAHVKVDPAQIDQVIVNLVLNARDAVPNGGTIQLATTYHERQNEPGSQRPEQPYYALAVTDNGIGIEPATLDRIWEPFFTTKEVGKGTGLGLATVYGIVKQAKGHISVESQVGKGTTFTVLLPAVQESLSELKPVESLSGLPRGTETILVVDDNEAVRSLAAMVLRSCGYTLLEAQNGVQAVDLIAHKSTKIDLLITDLDMPEMSGRTLGTIVRSHNPSIKILVITGYPEVPQTDQNTGAYFDTILKPFTPLGFATKVRQILDHPFDDPVI